MSRRSGGTYAVYYNILLKDTYLEDGVLIPVIRSALHTINRYFTAHLWRDDYSCMASSAILPVSKNIR